MSNFFQRYQVIVGFVVMAIVLSLTIIFLNKSSVQPVSLSKEIEKIELTQEYDYLFSDEFDPNQVTLFGVGLGDSINNVKTEDISEKNDIWVHTFNGAGYRPVGGKVVELVISSDLAKKFGIFRDEEILIRFGEPDKLEDTSGELFGNKEYFYIKKGLIVRYNDKLGVSVNILSK